MNVHRCFALFVIFVGLFLIKSIVLQNVDAIGEKYYFTKFKFPKVYDILHEITPAVYKYEYIADCISLMMPITVLLLDIHLFYTLMGYLMTIFIIRAITIQLTILPKYELCKVNTNATFKGGCYDKIFSGHIALCFMSSIILYVNNYINMFILAFINILNMYFIIVSRSHYTIDVIMSFLITFMVYQNKLNICNILNKYL